MLDVKAIASAVSVLVCLACVAREAPAQADKAAYAATAPVGAYLIADRDAEIALTRSAGGDRCRE